MPANARLIPHPAVCVIVPTYNNAATLTRVLDSVSDYVQDVIVVNDGSTDATSEILKSYPNFKIITHPKNSGKGAALQSGFLLARELGFEHAITIDSDGQHFPADIPLFLTEIARDPEQLIIGSRNMSQEGVPRQSNFGNNFSNFWFWFETGIRLQDTQSGFRVYPLKLLPKKFYTRKFEFEIEVIVRAAWRGIAVTNMPIRVLYDPGERVSHFRPYRDFTRISILNTVLVIICLFYIFPRNIIRKANRKGIRRFLVENILHSDDSNRKKALSIALGVFIGIAPFWGFQTILSLFLAAVLRLNKTISFAFSNVSFPPFIPFIILGSLELGALFYDSGAPLVFDASMNFDDIKQHLTQYLIGSFTLAAIAAVVFGIAGYGLLLLLGKSAKAK